MEKGVRNKEAGTIESKVTKEGTPIVALVIIPNVLKLRGQRISTNEGQNGT